MVFIEVKDLCFGYRKENILEHINFQIQKNQILCLIGPNGSGKTTLLDCIMGILSLRKGQVLLENKDISQLTAQQIAQKIAYVPQVHQKTFPYTVEEIVLMGRAAYHPIFQTPSYHDQRIAHHAIKTIGIKHLKDRPYTELSGGEGQLVMIARALAQQAKLMIMDEPTTHLDFQHSLLVLETIKRLVHENGIAIILATHCLNHAFYFENNNLDTVVVMLDKKKFAAFGKPSIVLSKEKIENVFQINCEVINHSLYSAQNRKYIIPIKTIP